MQNRRVKKWQLAERQSRDVEKKRKKIVCAKKHRRGFELRRMLAKHRMPLMQSDAWNSKLVAPFSQWQCAERSMGLIQVTGMRAHARPP
jgi:hypothetical protein